MLFYFFLIIADALEFNADEVDPPSISGKIVECSWNKEEDCWSCMRIRTDKSTPNDINTYRKARLPLLSHTCTISNCWILPSVALVTRLRVLFASVELYIYVLFFFHEIVLWSRPDPDSVHCWWPVTACFECNIPLSFTTLREVCS